MLLNKQWVKEEIRREIRKYFETIENGSTTCQNLRYAAKAVLRGEFMAINVYFKKQEKS